MKKTLEPFQQIGRAALIANYHHLLGDEPGLGKSLQTIAALEDINAKWVEIYCPASVRTNWLQEIEECVGHVPRTWFVYSYNYARVHAAELETRPSYRLDALVLDEAHFLKTVDSQRTLAVFGKNGIARRAAYIWPLTGTPVLNRPRELYPVLKTLHPYFADWSFAKFAQRFCGAYYDGVGMNTKGATNVRELAEILASFMTRRTAAEVFPHRVEPLVSVVPIEVSQDELRPVLEEEEQILDRDAYLSPTHEKFGQLGDCSRLLRLTGEAKVGAVARYVDELLETVDKVVVFFHHTEVGRRLYVHFSERGMKPTLYQGGMSDAHKDAEKHHFMREAGSRVFLGQIQTCGVGINGLQEVCRDAIFAEQEWVPGSMGQAIKRLDRMNRQGKYGDLVRVRILHAPGTMESALLGSREYKGRVIDLLMGDAARKPAWQKNIEELL